MTLVRFSISACSAWLVVLACGIGALLSMSALGACGYDDRDYAGVVFACDAQHPCPNGGPCVSGKCQPVDGGSGSGSAQQGVSCGSSVCAVGVACCGDFVGPLRCSPTGCTQEDFTLLCDGKEDCSGGRSCCLDGISTACTAGACNTVTVCGSDNDCPGNERFCCPFGAFPYPLKRCQPISC